MRTFHICLSVHGLVDIWVVSTLGLLGIMLLWTFVRFYVDVYFQFILRNCQTVFQGDCTVLHSHQRCIRVPISSQPHQCLFFFCFLFFGFWFFDYSHPSVCKVVSHVVLICVSLVTNAVKHLFKGLLAICISPLKKYFFNFK